MNRPDYPRQYMGGEMELDFDSLWGHNAEPGKGQFGDTATVSTGRTGIKLVLETLKEDFSGPFLLPSYLCPSILMPFLELGVPVEFFSVGDDLTPDPEELLRMVQGLSPRGLLFIDYFGFPVKEHVRKVLLEIKEQCWVVEDCCQISLSGDAPSGVGEIGHFVITSFRKYLPVPDGGLVINRTDKTLPCLPPDQSDFVRFRFLAKLIKGQFLRGGGAFEELERCYLSLFAAAEKAIDERVPMYSMSLVSRNLLSMIDWEEIQSRRQQNFKALLDPLSHWKESKSLVEPLFMELPNHVSPLVFPIRVKRGRRDSIRDEMRKRGAFCPVHWELPREVSWDRFPAAHKLSREILGLPIDQRYDEEDMEILIERLDECLAVSG